MADLADLLFEVFCQHDKEGLEESPPEKRETKCKRHHCEERRLCVDEERINQWLSEILTESQPFPGDEPAIDPTYEEGDPRFVVEQAKLGLVAIYDRLQRFDSHLHFSVIQSPEFSVARWYAERCVFNSGMP